MADFINIDNYFQKKLSIEEKEAFEKALATNAEFAEEVAFYAHAKATERENILQERHAQWKNRTKNNENSIGKIVRMDSNKDGMRIAIGIAAMLLIGFSFWFFGRNDISQQANSYIEQNLNTLPIKMDATEDSLELGKRYYNQQKYKEALAIFEQLIDKEPQAIEYAGLAAFQSKNYDIAEIYFEKLENNTELITNKGKFYKALLEIKQGKTQKGEQLLKEVISQNLGGKKEAEEILK